MKRKRVAAAALLMALLMPMAAYAEGTAPVDAPKAVQATPETAEEAGAADTLETNELVSVPVVLDDSTDEAITAPDILGEGQVWNSRNQAVYKTIKEAVEDAESGDTLYLGEGNFTLYGVSSEGTTKGKDLTFVGQSTDKTFWDIGTPTNATTGEANGDYSFDGANSVTFKSLTLRASITPDGNQATRDYTGFIRANHTIVDSCVIDGRTSYWGYETATFTNTTFYAPGSEYSKAPNVDYSLWTYSSPTMTFDGCTFYAAGKVINVYTDYGASQHDITVNFRNCSVYSSTSNKTTLNINDKPMKDANCGHKFFVNIEGNNTVNGIRADSYTCSRLFSFGGFVGAWRGYNAGCTVVKIEGTTVWENGVRTVDHNGNDFSTGSYNNGNGKDNANQYTEGYKDNAFKIVGTTEWTLKADTSNTYVRTIIKKCSYCGDKVEEQEEKNGYILSYDLNGGTGAENTLYDDVSYPPNDDNTATVAAAPSREGYVFAGWQDADGNLYAAGDTVTVDHDMTLTAQWNKLVTVTFDLCGHGGTIASQTFVSGGKASEPAAPKEDGWVFGGWYTERGCLNGFSFDTAVTSDITLYAKWTRVAVATTEPTSTPTPSPAPAATTKNVKSSAIPQTSDAFPIEGLLALLAVGAVGTGVAGYLRKKHH